jgi:hypothetical protein
MIVSVSDHVLIMRNKSGRSALTENGPRLGGAAVL